MSDAGRCAKKIPKPDVGAWPRTRANLRFTNGFRDAKFIVEFDLYMQSNLTTSDRGGRGTDENEDRYYGDARLSQV